MLRRGGEKKKKKKKMDEYYVDARRMVPELVAGPRELSLAKDQKNNEKRKKMDGWEKTAQRGILAGLRRSEERPA